MPVTDEKGWTYKNVFCARCNQVTIYEYWSLLARCQRSAPKQVISEVYNGNVNDIIEIDSQVLLGDPVMLSYYLRHFCSVKIQHKIKKDFKIFNESSSKKIRRPCNPKVISSCPVGYKDQNVVALCKSYQSIVITTGKFVI